jgi:transposase
MCCLAIDFFVRRVIQAPKLEHQFMRYELSDGKWAVIKPMLPNELRGIPRVDDRWVLNGIFWVLRSGAPGPSSASTSPSRSIQLKNDSVRKRKAQRAA